MKSGNLKVFGMDNTVVQVTVSMESVRCHCLIHFEYTAVLWIQVRIQIGLAPH
jgi:hypothetical protein